MSRKERRAAKKKQHKNIVQKSAPAPGSADALFQQGKLLSAQGQYADATRIFADILRAQPTHLGAIEELGVCAFKMKDFDKAVQFFKGMQLIDAQNMKAKAYLGTTYAEMEKFDEAFPLLHEALTKYDESFIHKGLGNAYIAIGKKDEGRHHLKRAHEIEPDNAEHLYAYVIKGPKIESEDDPRIQALKKFERKHSAAQKPYVYYALFNAYDALGQHEKAFGYAVEAAKAMRSKIEYSAEHRDQFVQQIERFFNKDFLDQYDSPKLTTDRPVFILGMPRSGTTLLEQILHAHPDVSGIGEDPHLADLIHEYSYFEPQGDTPYPLRTNPNLKYRLEPKEIAEKYEAHITEKGQGKKRVVNKEIGLFLLPGFINIAYEAPKMIHIKRNAMDSCLSSFFQYFAEGYQQATYDLTELGMLYKSYVEIMDYWNSVMPDNILNIHYEDIVDDIEGQARKVLDFLELPWNDACLEFYNADKTVKTASITQVRKPIYTSSIGRWRRYGTQVLPLIEALGHAAPEEAIAFLNEHKSCANCE